MLFIAPAWPRSAAYAWSHLHEGWAPSWRGWRVAVGDTERAPRRHHGPREGVIAQDAGSASDIEPALAVTLWSEPARFGRDEIALALLGRGHRNRPVAGFSRIPAAVAERTIAGSDGDLGRLGGSGIARRLRGRSTSSAAPAKTRAVSSIGLSAARLRRFEAAKSWPLDLDLAAVKAACPSFSPSGALVGHHPAHGVDRRPLAPRHPSSRQAPPCRKSGKTVKSAPRAYRLKASNAASSNSTSIGTIPAMERVVEKHVQPLRFAVRSGGVRPCSRDVDP
jgi:hypothetical protein